MHGLRTSLGIALIGGVLGCILGIGLLSGYLRDRVETALMVLVDAQNGLGAGCVDPGAGARIAEPAARGIGLLMVSHDIAAVAACCDRILVTQAGRIVEYAPRAAHPPPRARTSRDARCPRRRRRRHSGQRVRRPSR